MCESKLIINVIIVVVQCRLGVESATPVIGRHKR